MLDVSVSLQGLGFHQFLWAIAVETSYMYKLFLSHCYTIHAVKLLNSPKY